MALAAVKLDDKYTLDESRVYLTGTQAIVRREHHRRELDQVQCDLREAEGTTVLIYDQTCAAHGPGRKGEKR